MKTKCFTKSSRYFACMITMLVVMPCFAQLNIQIHHDFGQTCYGSELSNRTYWTATIENFKTDKWGSTYFFVDTYLGDNTMKEAYAEISRELKFWKAPIALHLEYNGGLANHGSYNDAYLIGAAYNWANKDYTRIFSLQAMYKYLANQKIGTKHNWQLTTVWGLHFAKGLFSATGYADLSHDNSVNAALIFSSEPQFWFNFAALKCVDDDFKLSLGTNIEISNNLIWPTNGKNNRFYTIPTLAMKWTF